ncbi:MAG: hypothetical protein K6U80_14920 [Firmicutes bacterium]|nr:hypothetical protein [Bacillota bacterium]
MEPNSIIRPVITIMDGRYVDLNHEFGGEPVELDLIFWGDNTVTLDCIAASFLGYNPQEIEYLFLANSNGLSDPNYKPERLDFKNLIDNRSIDLVEKSVFDRISVKLNQQRLKLQGKFDIYDQNACSGCRGALYFALEKIQKETCLDFNIFVGKPYEKPSDRSFAIGNCLKDAFKGETVDNNEIIAQTPKGIFVSYALNGSVDFNTGNFKFPVTEGRWILNGKLTDPVSNFYVTGNCVDAVRNIDLIGRNVETKSLVCGKGAQNIECSMAQPMIRITGLTIVPQRSEAAIK